MGGRVFVIRHIFMGKMWSGKRQPKAVDDVCPNITNVGPTVGDNPGYPSFLPRPVPPYIKLGSTNHYLPRQKDALDTAVLLFLQVADNFGKS